MERTPVIGLKRLMRIRDHLDTLVSSNDLVKRVNSKDNIIRMLLEVTKKDNVKR